jgi:uncharacterized repeat protein (TIGR03803 family)
MKSAFVSTPTHISSLVPMAQIRRCACALALFSILGLAATAFAQARTLTVLHTFGSIISDGADPEAGLIHDSGGNFYGVTTAGGTHNLGTVFKLDSRGIETVLYSFSGGTDGRYPIGGLIRDEADNLYGTTIGGAPGSPGFGTVFKLDTAGHETTLYTFTGGADGASPSGTLLRDASGNLYGTTQNGGTNCGNGCGTVFKVDPSGHETVLYSFTGGADGSIPVVGLIRDAVGNFYGTASAGGDLSACTNFGVSPGCGVVFKLDGTGTFSVLHTFSGGGDGGGPASPLTLDADGNLYGTAAQGGLTACQFGCGTLFKLDTSGTLTVLYSFPGGTSASGPRGPLLRDSAGFIWGTTIGGGRVNHGTVYRVDAAGHAVKLYNFTAGSDGGSPYGGVIHDAAGNFYGTAIGGGTFSAGTIFKLSQ